MKHEPKPMTHAEIVKLVERLKYYYVSRADAREAAELIQASYLGPRFHHKKRESNYTVVGEARLQTESRRQDYWKGPWDGDMLTLYRADDGTFSVRHPDEFNDGRFVQITKENEHEYVGGDASHAGPGEGG